MSTKDIFNKTIENKGFVFIAEISSNHLGKLSKLESLIKESKKAGADAVKIQTFSADSLTHSTHTGELYKIKEGPWKGITYRELYEKIQVPLEWTIVAKQIADAENIPIISSPFSIHDIDFLVETGFDMIKIASAELSHWKIMEHAYSLDCDIIASLGYYNEKSREQIEILQKKYGKKMYAALNCVAKYPANEKDLKRELFGVANEISTNSGLSDHSLDTKMIDIALEYGIKVVEKHVTLSRKDGGADSSFSLEMSELAEHIKYLEQKVNDMSRLSLYTNKRLEVESHQEDFSRSLYAGGNLEAGAMINKENIELYRPNIGISGVYFNEVIGKRLRIKKKEGEPIYFEDIEE